MSSRRKFIKQLSAASVALPLSSLAAGKIQVQTIPYQKVDVDVRANGKGLYWVELRDGYGRRLAINRVVVQ